MTHPTEPPAVPTRDDDEADEAPVRPPGLALARAARGAMAVMVGLALWGGLQILGGDSSSDAPDPAGDPAALDSDGPPLPAFERDRYPEAWDERFVTLVSFVERRRGLPFRAPVKVELLDPEEFQRGLVKDQRRALERLSAAERDALRSETGVLRALGLFEGEYDLVSHLDDPASAVLGYYDPETKVIRVSAPTLDLFSEATLVHELTHALQDQYFDLGRMENIESDGALAAFRALTEGDASRIEAAYVERFNDEELAQYLEGATAYFEASVGGEDGEDGVEQADTPEIYGVYAAAPYVLGETFVSLLEAARGAEAVDAAFREPPTGEEHILDPWTFIDGHERRPVDPPALEPGDRKIEDGDLGALTWYLLLAERIDPKATLLAFDGFGSDAYVTFDRAGRVCLAARFQGDTNADNLQMVGALEAWRDAMPPGVVTVTRRASVIDVLSCDPGTGAVAVTGRGPVAVLLPIVRTGIAVTLLDEGGTRLEAQCAGNGVIEEFSLDELVEFGVALAGGSGEGFLQRMFGVFQRCVGPDGPGGSPGAL